MQWKNAFLSLSIKTLHVSPDTCSLLYNRDHDNNNFNNFYFLGGLQSLKHYESIWNINISTSLFFFLHSDIPCTSK